MDLKIIYNFENFQLMNIRTEGESESKFTEQFVYTLSMVAVVYSLFLLAATTYECNWHNIVWFEEYIIHYMLLRRQHKQSPNKRFLSLSVTSVPLAYLIGISHSENQLESARQMQLNLITRISWLNTTAPNSKGQVNHSSLLHWNFSSNHFKSSQLCKLFA